MQESAIKPTSEFRAVLRGTALEDCFVFWRSLRVDGVVPLKSKIDPVAMPRHIIPYLFLHERTPEGRFRCRLYGTALCAAFQSDVTGLHLDETLPPETLADRVRLFQRVLDEERPVVFTGNVSEADRNWIKFCRVMMPISISGRGADAVFGMAIFPELDLRKRGRLPPHYCLPEIEAWAMAEDLLDDGRPACSRPIFTPR